LPNQILPDQPQPGQIREVVAVFDSAEKLDDAVFDLETQGFDRAAFSLLASEQAVEEKLGRRYRRVEEMEDETMAPRETFFSRASRLEAEFGLAPAVALMAAVAIGLGSTTITLPIMVAAGGGALVGAALGRLIHRHHAEVLQEQLERGGLLLWVNVRDPEEERKAIAILEAHAARHVHAHDLAA
jgi:hypothetical protein